MKALIFAAGIGSRLKPFTDSHPKALAPINGVPMLQRVIEKLSAAGVGEIVVNVHHFAGHIEDFLRANNNFGLDIAISDERNLLLDTGGGLLKAADILFSNGNEPVILHNADILTDFPIDEMLSQHLATGADATLLVAPRKSSRQLLFDSENNLKGWHNVATGESRPEMTAAEASALTPLAFGGVHIVNRSILEHLRDYAVRNRCKAFSITPFYLSATDSLTIKGFPPRKPFRWHDIGTPEKLAAAELSLIQ